jgi:predicted Rossmann-fold nucleotide-binding protein
VGLDSICVFAGSGDGNRREYRSAAESLGRSLAEGEITLVNGGSGIGLMGRVADAALADAFVALPGGLGTFEELLEAATRSKLGLQPKPCGVLNVRSYFDPLDALLEGAVDNGFLS